MTEQWEHADNLKRLRALSGLTQREVAEIAGIAEITYQTIERGAHEPRANTLQGIAKALGVRVEDIFEPLEMPKRVRFRAQRRMKCREAILADVTRRLNDYRELEELLGCRMPSRLNALVGDPPDPRPNRVYPTWLAGEVRNVLGLDANGPICDISSLLESAGVKVIAVESCSRGFFGHSVADDDLGPAVIVNASRLVSVERQIFTAAHELGHLLMHAQSYDIDDSSDKPHEEHEADIFASRFIMPEDAFRAEWDESRGLRFVHRVLKVKRIFRVSYETVLYRLQPEDVHCSSKYAAFRGEYRKLTGQSLAEHREPMPLQRGADFVPDRFQGLVRQALEAGAITMSRAAEMMRMDLREMREYSKTWRAV